MKISSRTVNTQQAGRGARASARRSTRVTAIAATAVLGGSTLLVGGGAVAAEGDLIEVKASQVSTVRTAGSWWVDKDEAGLGAFAVTQDGPDNDTAMELTLPDQAGNASKVYLYDTYAEGSRPTDIPALLEGASYTYAGTNVNLQIEVIYKPLDGLSYGPDAGSTTCTPAATWYGWELTADPEWCYSNIKWEPYVSPGMTWTTVDLSQDSAALSSAGTGGWVAHKRIGEYAGNVSIGQTMTAYLGQMEEYQVTSIVIGAGSGTQGPAHGWVKDYTIGATTRHFVAEPGPVVLPPAPDDSGLDQLISDQDLDVVATTKTFSLDGAAAGTGLDAVDPTSPVDAILPWSSPDSFVEVYAYSTPVHLGTFPVVDGEVVLTGLDLSGLEAGAHRLVFLGQTSNAVQVAAITIALKTLVETGGSAVPAILLGGSLALLGAGVLLMARRRRHTAGVTL